VRTTAEIGVFKLIHETSSAANVRRVEALTGPEAVALLRRHDDVLREAASGLRKRPEEVASAVAELRERAKAAGKQTKPDADVDVSALVAGAATAGDVTYLAASVPGVDAKSLPDLADRVKGQLGEASAVVLGSTTEGRVHLVAAVAPAAIERGVRAGELVKVAAAVVGGGGGGRDTMAQAGGKDPSKLEEALDAARSAIEAALS
jgi:alanyl-tRNA synthetase